MHVFDIYRHPRYGLQAVRRGFSWSAFLLPSVWAVRRGLGITTLILIIATTLVFDVTELAGQYERAIGLCCCCGEKAGWIENR